MRSSEHVEPLRDGGISTQPSGIPDTTGQHTGLREQANRNTDGSRQGLEALAGVPDGALGTMHATEKTKTKDQRKR